MKCLLSQAARKFPHHPALISGPKIITYAQFEQSVNAAVRKLKKLGITSGARVAIQSPNCIGYCIVLIALWRMKATTCLLSTRLPPHLSTKQEVDGTALPLSDKGSEEGQRDGQEKDGAVLATSKNQGKSAPLPIARGQLKTLKCQFIIRSFKNFAVVTNNKLPLVEETDIPLNHSTTIMFTSGSSDTPKAAVHTFANHYYSALGSNENIRVAPGDRWLLSLPLYHVGGLGILFRCLLAGGTVVIPADSKNFAAAIRHYRVTHLSLVVTQLGRLLKSKNKKFMRTVKAILLGGGPIPQSFIQMAIQRKWPVYLTYGLTEMTSQVATSTPPERFKKGLNSAKVLKYRKVRIALNGEILVKGKTLFKGYVKNPKTVLPLLAGGWFPTGDRGEMTRQGRLKILGRNDNMFISGGENIQPEEIEKHLNAIAGVEQAIVVAKEDREFGKRPVAFIKVAPQEKIPADQFKTLLSRQLPRFKIPSVFYHWPQQGVAQGLKANRRSLQQMIDDPRKLQSIE